MDAVRHTLPLKKIRETDDKKLEDELVKMSISLGELNQFLHQPVSLSKSIFGGLFQFHQFVVKLKTFFFSICENSFKHIRLIIFANQ